MSIFIFRRDFRLSDNIGLINLLKDSTDSIIPIFIFTPKQIKRNSYKSYNCIQFMIDSLKDLNESIKISIRFLTNEIRTDSLDIKVFNRQCNSSLNCKVSESDGIISKELKRKIV